VKQGQKLAQAEAAKAAAAREERLQCAFEDLRRKLEQTEATPARATIEVAKLEKLSEQLQQTQLQINAVEASVADIWRRHEDHQDQTSMLEESLRDLASNRVARSVMSPRSVTHDNLMVSQRSDGEDLARTNFLNSPDVTQVLDQLNLLQDRFDAKICLPDENEQERRSDCISRAELREMLDEGTASMEAQLNALKDMLGSNESRQSELCQDVMLLRSLVSQLDEKLQVLGPRIKACEGKENTAGFESNASLVDLQRLLNEEREQRNADKALTEEWMRSVEHRIEASSITTADFKEDKFLETTVLRESLEAAVGERDQHASRADCLEARLEAQSCGHMAEMEALQQRFRVLEQRMDGSRKLSDRQCEVLEGQVMEIDRRVQDLHENGTFDTARCRGVVQALLMQEPSGSSAVEMRIRKVEAAVDRLLEMGSTVVGMSRLAHSKEEGLEPHLLLGDVNGAEASSASRIPTCPSAQNFIQAAADIAVPALEGQPDGRPAGFILSPALPTELALQSSEADCEVEAPALLASSSSPRSAQAASFASQATPMAMPSMPISKDFQEILDVVAQKLHEQRSSTAPRPARRLGVSKASSPLEEEAVGS